MMQVLIYADARLPKIKQVRVAGSFTSDGGVQILA